MKNKKVRMFFFVLVVACYVHQGIADGDCKQDETEMVYDKSSMGKHLDKSNYSVMEVMKATVTVNGIQVFDRARLDLFEFNYFTEEFFRKNVEELPEDLEDYL